MKFKRREGFTLIEVILSIVLLSIISISILPMSIHAIRLSKWNNIRQNAMSMAYTQIEWLKTLDYKKELELKGKFLPPNDEGKKIEGMVEERLFMNEIKSNPKINDGIEYRFLTSIYWEGGASTTGQYIPNALRKVDVVVSAKNPLSGEEKEYSVIGTLIAYEGERPVTIYPSLKVIALQGSEAIKNVKFELFKNLQNYPINWTRSDEKGEAIFVELFPEEYEIEVKDWQKGEIMGKPNKVIGTKNNQKWRYKYFVEIDGDIYSEKELKYYIDYPGFIKLYNISETVINNSKIIFTPKNNESVDDSNDLEITTPLKEIVNIKFWRNWAYDNIINYNGTLYKLLENDTNVLWSGEFEYNDDKISITELTLGYLIEQSTENKYTIENNKLTYLDIVLPKSLNILNQGDELSNLNISLYILNDEDKEIDFNIVKVNKVEGSLNKYRIEINTEDAINGEEKIKLVFNDLILDENGIGMAMDYNFLILDENINN